MLMALTLAPVELSWALLRNFFSLSFDRLVMAHRSLGLAVILVVLLHGTLETYCFFLVAWQLASDDNNQWRTAATETWKTLSEVQITAWGAGNLFGLLAALCLVLLGVGVLMRRRSYECFLWSHMLFSVCAVVFTALHCFEFVPVALLLIFWYIFSHCYRRRRRTHGYAYREVLSEGPYAATLLSMPYGREQQPGSWFLVRVSEIDTTWHPFSNAASPTEGKLSFVCQPTGKGSWSWQLAQLGNSEVSMAVEGPYGSIPNKVLSAATVVLVAGGSGLLGVLSVFLFLHQQGRPVHLHWVVRSSKLLSWLYVLGLPPVGDNKLNVTMYYTTCDADSEDHKMLGESMGVDVEPGRPHLNELLRPLCSQDAVMVCGPKAMVQSTKVAAPTGVVVHCEEFLW